MNTRTVAPATVRTGRLAAAARPGLLSLLGLLGLLLVAAAPAAADEPPGFVDLSWIEIPADAREIQDVDLTVMLADLAADARAEGEDQLADLLGTITSLRVKAYSLDGPHEASREAAARVLEQLEDGGWSRILYLKDGEETMSVSTYREDGHLVGVTAVAYEPGGQVGFVNVVGNLDLGHLLRLARDGDLAELGARLEAGTSGRVE
jgi:hypothetical protein